MWQIVFWSSVALCGYVYAGFAVLLALVQPLLRRKVRKAEITPDVSLLIPAYNEADVIAAKVASALALDYPPEHLEIVVASDGSSDGTAQIAERAGVRVIAYPKNRGKVAVLNDTVPQLRGDIVVFSDASSMLERNALRLLVQSFADPKVGAVSGVYQVKRRDQAALGRQEDFYWRYETLLKLQEYSIASILGAHGSLYGIRKKLYPFPKLDTINDDYVIPLRIVQQGYRVVYEPDSVAWEEAHEMQGFGRRIRIMRGNVQQIREIVPLMTPPRPFELFFFLSHKVGRLAVPFAMLGAAVSNLFLLDHPFYQFTGVLQLMFYVLVLANAFRPLTPKLLRLPFYFFMINAAAMIAIYQVAFARQRMAWK